MDLPVHIRALQFTGREVTGSLMHRNWTTNNNDAFRWLQSDNLLHLIFYVVLVLVNLIVALSKRVVEASNRVDSSYTKFVFDPD